MSYEGSNRNGKQPASAGKAHSLAMEDRRQLSVSGVEDVESFDEREIVMRTVAGNLVVGGEELSVSRLSVDSGDVSVQGRISSLQYEEQSDRRGLWAKLFH